MVITIERGSRHAKRHPKVVRCEDIRAKIVAGKFK
jgi:hypothetical protein